MSKTTSIENYFQKLTQQKPETECDTNTDQPTLLSSTSSSQKSAAKCSSQSQHAKEPDRSTIPQSREFNRDTESAKKLQLSLNAFW